MEIWDDDGGHIRNISGKRDLIDKVLDDYRRLAASRDSNKARIYQRTVSNW